jgi:nitroimidazol reductase NimA-like FMN-containing flavoprotein (pyridoxamine 5'-phosphate oxidase superfamily)
MPESDENVMDAAERDSFLGSGGTGVLSFSSAADEPPHAVPVSYGYDAAETTFYFRLAAGSETEKGHLADRPVTFVVHGKRDATWRSVVANGRLEGTTDQGVATDALEGLEQVHIPLVDIFGKPVKDVSFEFYRLVPDEMSSRTETTTSL